MDTRYLKNNISKDEDSENKKIADDSKTLLKEKQLAAIAVLNEWLFNRILHDNPNNVTIYRSLQLGSHFVFDPDTIHLANIGDDRSNNIIALVKINSNLNVYLMPIKDPVMIDLSHLGFAIQYYGKDENRVLFQLSFRPNVDALNALIATLHSKQIDTTNHIDEIAEGWLKHKYLVENIAYKLLDLKQSKSESGFFKNIKKDFAQSHLDEMDKVLKNVNPKNAIAKYEQINTLLKEITIYTDAEYQQNKKPKWSKAINEFYKKLKEDFKQFAEANIQSHRSNRKSF